MNKRLTMRVLPLVLSSLFAVSAANAQNVSSAVNGRVLDATGQPMSGAKIEILHVPSGTVSVVTADEQGRYKAAGLRVGGPYRITAEGATSITKDDVYLRLAEST
ncbi:MAG: carboxypeptidase-like regulatory domain-containing protein, partial [Dokdonella sp.]